MKGRLFLLRDRTQVVHDVPDLLVLHLILPRGHVEVGCDTVLDVVELLSQASSAVNVLVIERKHPSLTTLPSTCVIVGDPQKSVAVAVPSKPAGSAGLQPRFTSS